LRFLWLLLQFRVYTSLSILLNLRWGYCWVRAENSWVYCWLVDVNSLSVLLSALLYFVDFYFLCMQIVLLYINKLCCINLRKNYEIISSWRIYIHIEMQSYYSQIVIKFLFKYTYLYIEFNPYDIIITLRVIKKNNLLISVEHIYP